MTFALFVEAFHFLRPLWLIAIPLIGLLWFLARRGQHQDASLAAQLPPHLRAALTVGHHHRRRLQPIDVVAMAMICAALGAAGPTWSRVPNPFVSQTAPLVIVLEVSTAMENTDVAPSRLERAKHKIRDLMTERAGGRTALVAYAGTAHRVVPYTEDPAVITPYLEGLSTDTMPVTGNNASDALALAQSIAATTEGASGILFVLPLLDQADVAAFTADNAAAQIAFLKVAPAGAGGGALEGLNTLITQELTADTSDIRALNRQLNAAYQASLLQDDRQQWDDRGWLLAWPMALLILLWFRRGMTLRWAAYVLAAGLMMPAQPSRADGIADWFFTPDQQGQIAYNRKKFTEAADLFVDPMWHAYAQYRDGQYEAAAQSFARIDTADAAIGEGMAQIKNRSYRDGVRAFERALEIDPENTIAQHNLEVAKIIVDYVETAREQSDTGEDSGIGADEVVFDNEAAKGVDTEIEPPTDEAAALLTTEQWMNTVDTSAGDFLRQRFALEAAQGTP